MIPVSAHGSASVTGLLASLSAGDPAAFDSLLPIVYGDLRRVAGRLMASERPGNTLSATGLVHEAYLRLVGQEPARFHDRAHFLAVASVAMRRILITRARARHAAKRGGGMPPVTLSGSGPTSHAVAPDELLAIDQVLGKLEELNPRQGKVVTYRFYGGLTDEEIAEVLRVSAPTVRRDWRAAKAWLTRELEGAP